jgi:hypothetical protein
MALFTRPGLWQRPSSHTYPTGPCGTVPIGPPNAIPCFGGQSPASAAPDHCRPPGPPLPPIACLTSRRTPPYLSTTHGIGPHPILFLTNAVRLVKKATVAPTQRAILPHRLRPKFNVWETASALAEFHHRSLPILKSLPPWILSLGEHHRRPSSWSISPRFISLSSLHEL